MTTRNRPLGSSSFGEIGNRSKQHAGTAQSAAIPAAPKSRSSPFDPREIGHGACRRADFVAHGLTAIRTAAMHDHRRADNQAA